jgi:phenylpropionate dioxygenase-like ring-hydroxylating dioxygenase large terminal subunit
MALRERELGAIGPVLSDGTAMRDLIDTDKREVSLRLLNDPEVYQLELERLFARAWIVVAHESEIPNAGDYVLRQIGEDVVIVVRSENGTIEILLNVCTHRAMQVCRAEVGNATKFKCPYHGWIFDTDGAFRAAPFHDEMYGDCLDKSSLGLQRARSEVYAGIVFGCWDEQAPTLEEYIGDFRWYIDTIFGRTNEGIEVIGSPQRYNIHANWKTAGEQFAGDGYHTMGLHYSLIEMGWLVDPRMAMYGIDVSTKQGHGIRCIDLRGVWNGIEGASDLTPVQKLQQVPMAGLPPELVEELASRFSEKELASLSITPPTVGGMFPNLSIIAFYGPVGDDAGTMGPTFGLHTFVPTGFDSFEYMNWVFVERGASEEYKRLTRRTTVFGTGSSGVVEQDDAEAWPSMQKSSRGFIGRKHSMKYQALLGENKPDDWMGGGLVYDGFSKDDNQWNWWLRYLEYMTGDPSW